VILLLQYLTSRPDRTPFWVSAAIERFMSRNAFKIKTKRQRKREIKFNKLKVFATGKDIDRLLKPFKSRFMEFTLPEYT
jgi:hypothetical protein